VGLGVFHVQELQMRLLVVNNGVDVVLAPETVIDGGEERVSISREVDSNNLGALVG
jgi:hypothetical protein